MQTTFAEKVLPKGFFPKLGLYVANCSYLERQIWLTIVKVECLEAGQDEDEILQIKKLPTHKLLKRLAKSAEQVPVNLRQRIIDISGHMRRFVDNRHMAIHGTWFAEGDDYRVEYFRNFGGRKSPDWREYTETVTGNDIDEAIEDCSRLICELLDVCNQIKRTGF